MMKQNKIFAFILAFSLFSGSSVPGNAVKSEKKDSICTHPIVRGDDGHFCPGISLK
jgi:hypothetical protein